MQFEKIHNKGQVRLFKNDFLEALTKANPLVIWGMYIPILTYIIYLAATRYDYSTKTILLVFFGGMFFWTFFEYIAHRFIFHWIPKSPRATKFVYTLHGNHHHYPRDKQRLFMPPVPSLIISPPLFSLNYLIMGPFVFDAVSAGKANVTTGTATRDPFEPAISFTRGMLNFPFLKNVVTDSHFRQRERFGRLAAFMARQFADGAIAAPNLVTGLGVDEATAVLLDKNGKGLLAPGSTGAAYVMKSANAVRIVKGQSLLTNTLDVIRLDAAGQYYDFVKACGTGSRFNFTVDGDNLYPIDAPYTVTANPGTCP